MQVRGGTCSCSSYRAAASLKDRFSLLLGAIAVEEDKLHRANAEARVNRHKWDVGEIRPGLGASTTWGHSASFYNQTSSSMPGLDGLSATGSAAGWNGGGVAGFGRRSHICTAAYLAFTTRSRARPAEALTDTKVCRVAEWQNGTHESRGREI